MEKRVADSVIEQVHGIMPQHLNGAGRLFGGILMQWIDEVAGLTAIRHSQSPVVTASVDSLRFLRGVSQNEMVVLIGKLTYVYGSARRYLRGKSGWDKISGQPCISDAGGSR